MKYYCNEDARNLVELEIKNRREALKLYDGIIEVVEKFNGKVLNKRFDTALKNVDKRLGFNRSYSSFEIEMSLFDNDSCKSVKKDSFGYSHTIYITNRYLILNSYLETYTLDRSKKSLLDNERIVSSVLIESLNNGRKQIEEKIVALEESLDKVVEWREKLESLKNEMEKTMKDIPYIIRDYYDMNYRVDNR